MFGHEAGHVKERHITYYLLFAIGSMVGVSLVGDWMAVRPADSRPTWWRWSCWG